MSKILGIIPARYASSRFPGKPLADICGRAMIQRVFEQAKQALSLCDVIVATDDARIYDCVKSFGGRAVMTSPDLPNGTSRCEQAAKEYLGNNNNIDAVINIQGDEPLLDPVMIDEVADLLSLNECVTLCREMQDNDYAQDANTVKVVMDLEGNALYFSRALIPYRRNDVIKIYQHIGIYGYSLDFLIKYVQLEPTPLSESESLEQLRILEHGYKIRVGITKSQVRSLGVDTPRDLEKVKAMIDQCQALSV